MAHIPEPVSDLAARQVVDEVVAAWSWPLLTTEGAAARRLSRFTLRAVEVGAGITALPAEGIDEHGREIAVIEAGSLADKSPGDRFELRFPLADWKLGSTVILAVTAANRAGRSAGYSNQVRLHPVEPPDAAALAQPEVTAQGAALTWAASAGADSYVVERRVEGETDFRPVARVEQPRFLDRAAAWGLRHEYQVRPFAATPAGEAEGRCRQRRPSRRSTSSLPPPPKGFARYPQGLRSSFPGASTGNPTWPVTACCATARQFRRSSSAPLSATRGLRRTGSMSTRSRPLTTRETKAPHRPR